MILQRIANHGLFLGELFEQAARDHPYQLIKTDQPLSVAPQRGCELTAYTCANLVAELAAAVRDAGVLPKDRVVLYKTDNFDTFLLICALAYVGAVPVALSPELPPETARYLIDRCGRPHLILDPATYEGLAPANAVSESGSYVTFVLGAEIPGTIQLLPQPVSQTQRYGRPDPKRPMLVTHTSGTTGPPKLVVHSAWTMRARYRPQALGARMLIRRHDTVALQISFVHSRMVTAMAIALRRGLPLVILPNGTPDTFADLLARTQPSVVEALPNSLIDWESLAGHPRAPLANLKVLSTTFDAIHPRTVRTLLGASNRRCPVHVQLYGQSEVGPVSGRVVTKYACGHRNWRSVGFAFPGMTAVRVLGDADSTSPSAIAVSTDGRAITYLGEDERFAEQLHSGWWQMGDIGWRKRRGDIVLADREIDQIGGIDSVLAIEDALLERLTDLLEVVLISDEKGRPTPIVVTRDGAPVDEVSWQLATEGLPSLRSPIQLDRSEMPCTSTKKVQRVCLARRLFGAEIS